MQTLLTKQVFVSLVHPVALLHLSFSLSIDLFCVDLQETFDAGLQAFQQEGITNITALKDQLLAAKHVQAKAIEARHAALMKRWNQLLSNSKARKMKLLEAQVHFRKVKRPVGLVGLCCGSWDFFVVFCLLDDMLILCVCVYSHPG